MTESDGDEQIVPAREHSVNCGLPHLMLLASHPCLPPLSHKIPNHRIGSLLRLCKACILRSIPAPQLRALSETIFFG